MLVFLLINGLFFMYNRGCWRFVFIVVAVELSVYCSCFVAVVAEVVGFSTFVTAMLLFVVYVMS